MDRLEDQTSDCRFPDMKLILALLAYSISRGSKGTHPKLGFLKSSLQVCRISIMERKLSKHGQVENDLEQTQGRKLECIGPEVFTAEGLGCQASGARFYVNVRARSSIAFISNA